MAELAYPPRTPVQNLRIVTAPWIVVRALRITGSTDELVIRSGRDESEGNEDVPCIRLGTLGCCRLRVAVNAGSRSVSVYAKQPVTGQPRPRLVVRSNAEIGLAQDLTQTAASGADWVEIGPITFTASQRGGVWVELWNPSVGWPCWFDDLTLA